jgi:hypothetical protein
VTARWVRLEIWHTRGRGRGEGGRQSAKGKRSEWVRFAPVGLLGSGCTGLHLVAHGRIRLQGLGSFCAGARRCGRFGKVVAGLGRLWRVWAGGATTQARVGGGWRIWLRFAPARERCARWNGFEQVGTVWRAVAHLACPPSPGSRIGVGASLAASVSMAPGANVRGVKMGERRVDFVHSSAQLCTVGWAGWVCA